MSHRGKSPTFTAGLAFALALLMALALSACGGSSDSGGDSGSANQQETASLAAVCAAKVKMAKGIAKLKSTDAESAVGPGKVANWMDSIRQGMTSVTEQLPKLSASDRQKVQAASDEFTTSFVDLGLDMSTALGQSNANAKIQAKVAQISDAFDASYGTISCPQQ